MLTSFRFSDEGVLIISGGLTVHTFEDFSAWEASTADAQYLDLHASILKAIESPGKSEEERNAALVSLVKHPSFRRAHPREEHFVPIYVAAGAGGQGSPKLLCSEYGIVTAAFGV